MNIAHEQGSIPPAAASLKKVQKLMYDGQFELALEAISSVLITAPEDLEALYIQAVCLRYLKRYQDALVIVTTLLELSPEFGRAFQEQGHIYRAMGKNSLALKAFQLACQANPALIASWRIQAELLAQDGQENQAHNAQAQADHMVSLPKELLSVNHLIHEGKILKAETLCRSFLQKNPQHIEAMRLLADIAMRLGVLDDADFLLESAIVLAPSNIQIRLDYIQVLRKRQKFEAALSQAQFLYEQNPDSPIFQSHYAIERLQTGDFDGAITLFDKVLERLPEDPSILTSRGHALKTFGKQKEAIASYKQAYQAVPSHSDAYFALSNLKTYRFSKEEIVTMRDLEAGSDITYKDRINLCFALGKALEDQADYKDSFLYYERGNDLKRLQSRYNADQMHVELTEQIKHCNKTLFESKGTYGYDAPDPIFIVGLPRAGSTLLEQILASHSKIDGTLELPNILSLAQGLRGRNRRAGQSNYPANLHELTKVQLSKFGEQYIDQTRIHRGSAPFFTDKMPNNFRHIGFIHLILPNAKIIDARREPMACCFSGFKQLFAEGQEFTYGLKEIGQYYHDYVMLMRHWDKVLPGKILRVQHEDVIADLEGQTRRMLDFCGLDFESACLEFYNSKRSVRTASSEQVRQPINTSAADKWRAYTPFLEPLQSALGASLVEYQN